MEIKTKFDVNNIIKHKFTGQGKNKIVAHEVIDIQTGTCMAGTQIFYVCRPLIATKEHKDFYKKGKYAWNVEYAVAMSNGADYAKLREDEVVEVTDEECKIFLGEITGGED